MYFPVYRLFLYVLRQPLCRNLQTSCPLRKTRDLVCRLSENQDTLWRRLDLSRAGWSDSHNLLFFPSQRTIQPSPSRETGRSVLLLLYTIFSVCHLLVTGRAVLHVSSVLRLILSMRAFIFSCTVIYEKAHSPSFFPYSVNAFRGPP